MLSPTVMGFLMKVQAKQNQAKSRIARAKEVRAACRRKEAATDSRDEHRSLLDSNDTEFELGSLSDHPPENVFALEKAPLTTASSIRCMLDSKLNVLLVFCILGPMSAWSGMGDTLVFTCNFLAILPLAQLLGTCTEEVALRTNETIGGLINASLGNATELIISIFAISNDLLRVTQVSLLGSILSNQLLVTGFCFFCGGLNYSEQSFNVKTASIESSLLLLVVFAMAIPAVYNSTTGGEYNGVPCNSLCRAPHIVEISRFLSIIMLIVYGMLLVFQLKTHKYLQDEEAKKANDGDDGEIEEGEDDVEEPQMTLTVALTGLTVSTGFIALSSEYLVDSIEGVTASLGISEVFIGLILLPIVGNAAEHMTAVTVAMKGKMDLALGVAIGSSLQIALCVLPLCVLLGWSLGKELTLDFHPFETTVLVVSVLVVVGTLSDSTSTWLEGAVLLCSYLIIGVVYYFRVEELYDDCDCGDSCCLKGYSPGDYLAGS